MQSTILLIVFFFIFMIVVFSLMLSMGNTVSDKDFRYKKLSLMTKNEIEFYKKIRNSFKIHQLKFFVFPQVAMSAVIKTNESDNKRRSQAWGKISQKRIDFGIYDESFNIVCIIELDDRTHNSEKDIKRDKLTQSANIKTLRYYQKNTTPEIIADDILQIVSKKTG